jgi:hypothetical protein
MMKVGPAVGIVCILLLFSCIAILAYLYLMTPTCILPREPPLAAIAHDESSPDYTLKIIKVSERVPLSDIEIVFRFSSNDSVSVYKLKDLIHMEPNLDAHNISYHDNDHDNKLSAEDLLILKTDWDGPDSDGNSDRNFMNDGPFGYGDSVKLIHNKTSGTICKYTIKT